MKFLFILLSVACLEIKGLYYLGVRETSSNAGPQVEPLLKKCGLRTGEAWCGCYAYVVHSECNADHPSNYAWAAAWGVEHRIVWRRGQSSQPIQPGMTVLLWYNHLQRIGHVGIILYKSQDGAGEYVIYHSGNTRSSNIVKGEGVHLVKMYLRQIYAVADWITPSGNSPAKYHVVKYQENLYRLGIKYKTTPAELRRLNGLRDDDPIFIGQHLRVQ